MGRPVMVNDLKSILIQGASLKRIGDETIKKVLDLLGAALIPQTSLCHTRNF